VVGAKGIVKGDLGVLGGVCDSVKAPAYSSSLFVVFLSIHLYLYLSTY